MARGNFTKRKSNTYELFDTYGICHMSHGKSFLFDLEDLPHVQAHYWTVNSEGYAVSYYFTRNEDNKRVHHTLRFHRLVMNPPENMDVDHIFGDKLDNRKSKMRICTSHENDYNHDAPRNNTSGYVGVSQLASGKGWRAYITKFGKQIHLGCFEDIKDAIVARQAAEIHYYGEFSRSSLREEVANA